MILVDTNILARLANKNDSHYQSTRAAISGCWRKGRKLYICDQTLQEFWVLATRPKEKNGLGMTPSRANSYLTHFSRTFNHLGDPSALYETWRQFVNAHGICGIHSYDARFAAFVHAHGFSGFMTYNLPDFRPFSIPLVDPNDPATW